MSRGPAIAERGEVAEGSPAGAPGALASHLAGRSLLRYRRAFLTIGGTAITRGLQAAFSLVTVPLALTYFGRERYGFWLTLSALLNVLVYVDVGFGNVLIHMLSHADGREDRQAAQRQISAAFFTTLAAGAGLLALVLATYPVAPWARVFNVEGGAAASDAGPAILVLAAVFSFSAVAGVGQRVYQGYQRGFISSLSQTVGSALALVGLVGIVKLRLSLPWLVVTAVGGPAMAAAASSAVLFWRSPWLAPRLRALDTTVVRGLLRSSAMFVGIQFAWGVGIAADNLLVAHVLGPEIVPAYGIPARLFFVLQMLIAVVPQAFWPACREALARGDRNWARHAFTVSLGLTVGAAALTGSLLVVFGNDLLRLWVGGEVVASLPLLLGLMAFMVAYSAGTSIWIYAVALGQVSKQFIWSVAVLVLSLALRVLLLPRYGIASLPAAMAFSYLVAYVVPGAIAIHSADRAGAIFAKEAVQ